MRRLRLALMLFLLGSAVLYSGCQTGRSPEIRAADNRIHELDVAATGLYRQERYAEAVPYLRQMLAVAEKETGPDDIRLVKILNNLASALEKSGRTAEAESLYLRILEIIQKRLGESDPAMGRYQADLGDFYRRTGRLEKARHCYEIATGVVESAEGRDSLLLDRPLIGLAAIHDERGDSRQAEALYQRAADIVQKNLGPEHPFTGRALERLAAHDLKTGRNNSAFSLFRKALTIREKALGPDHPAVAARNGDIGRLLMAEGQYDGALWYLSRSASAESGAERLALGLTRRNVRLSFLEAVQNDTGALLELAADHYPADAAVAAGAYDAWLHTKLSKAESWRAYDGAFIHHAPPGPVEVYRRFLEAETRLADALFTGPVREDPSVWRKQIAEMSEDASRLQARLTEIEPRYAGIVARRDAGAEAVLAALPEDSVLVEYARVPSIRTSPGKNGPENRARYVVFVVQARPLRKITLADIGDAAEIDRAVDQYRRTFSNSRAYGRLDRTEACRRLHDLVWAPVRSTAGKPRRMFIAPDGLLSLIPFETLMDENGRFLLERHTFEYLASGKDLLPGRAGDVSSDRCLVLTAGAGLSGAGSACVLSGADAAGNGRALARVLGKEQTRLLTDPSSGKEILAELKTPPRILHVESCVAFRQPDDNPFEQAALGIPAWRQERRHPDGQASPVTALDLLTLDLSGVELVSLMGIARGPGSEPSPEGVLMLRLAFARAGAKRLLIGLNPLSERDRIELMQDFYANLISRNMPAAEALSRAASEGVKRAKKRYAGDDPLHWGGLVLSGRPGSL